MGVGDGAVGDGRPAPPTTMLGPGFRFHPTDEELVRYYLKRKVSGKPVRFDCIADIDLYKSDPWELPGQSLLKTRDLEWYFFTALDKKYGHGSRTNRATGQGYWKTTGKDHPVLHQSRVVGMRKTLVYHAGRAPHGERTNWVMHEYRLEDEEPAEAGIPQDAYVLCRIFQKSGAGPKNGEQYGAPFVEEEWEDKNHEVAVSKKNNRANANGVGLLEVEGVNMEGANALPLQEMHQLVNVALETDPNFLGATGSDPVFSMSQPCHDEEMLLENKDEDAYFAQFMAEDYIEINDVNTLMKEIGSPSHLNDEMFVLDELCNSPGELLSSDEFFLQYDDLVCPNEGRPLNSVEARSPGPDWVDEFLNNINDGDDDMQLFAALGSSSTQQSEIAETPALPEASQAHAIAGASSSKRKANSSCYEVEKKATVGGESDGLPDAADIRDENYGDGWGKSLAKRLHGMLGSIPSSPAFAAENPFKGKAKAMEENPQATLAGPIRIQAGMFYVTDFSMACSIQKNWPLTKDGHQEGYLFTYATEHLMTSQKVASSISRWGFYLCLLWVLLFAISVKIGVSIYARYRDNGFIQVK